MVQKIEKLTKVPIHPWLKREIFFSHRDLDITLNEFEKGNKFYLYTGRGPSGGSMHLGHLMPFIFTKYLQDAFDVPLVIQLTDDEKFFHKGETTLEEYQKMGIENAKDIIACGFDINKTFIFLDTEYIGHMYMNVCKFQKNITYNQLRGIFGVNQSDIIGKMAYPAIQAAPALSSSFKHIFGDKIVPCLVPQVPKTACIHNKFFPALQGFNSKMSTSDPNSAIFLTDTPQQIKDKINKHAFSGGQQTKELQEKFGANLEVDIPYQYLRFFLDDDQELEKIGKDYSSGKMLTSAIKGKLIELLQKLILEHQERRAKVTDEDVRKFMEIRKLNF
ncbi:hypothetical protein PPERSA_08933 [Pseudocohnilembus persalinus]|uniref:Tryptophan--tRNA ligase, cytoplasmic n=1 Tax=Pseudocohnilembus persalinus TaxID=266149 RepID=A0A0V0R338_PSEPJ|nr:hypothetical protein PPERSA_08933 [Pseudocohnilembus persalinus]|eukprot:KRX08829.1 hypothetical protein PPERSA_08933 [Pseudocohnilembus persalinus]